MTKTLALTLCALLATLALAAAPSSAGAKIADPRRDRRPAGLDVRPAAASRRAKFKLVRYFVPWNIEQNKDDLALATAYVERARRDHIQVLLHISSDDLRDQAGQAAVRRAVQHADQEDRRDVPRRSASATSARGTR